MKYLICLIVFVFFSCRENKKLNDSTVLFTKEVITETKNENYQLVFESKFYCHIQYLDAIFLNKTFDCDDPKPVEITKDSITLFVYGNIDLIKVILYLDSLTQRETKFKFNLGTFGALITNYSDSLYTVEREAWINEYENKMP